MFGLASVALYVIPAIVFLVPASLVSAELASGWKGGVYNWVSEGISPAMGFGAVWCQFAQTTFYYPAVLAYIASTLSYVFAPGLAHSGVYTTVVIIVLFWASVLVAHISLTAGVMQAFRSLLDHFSLSFLEPVVAIGLVLASISGLLDWLAGPSTGLVQIGREQGYLPRYFQQVNANGVQLRILVAQGIVITLIGLLYAVVPTVSRAYWVFAALATEVYLIMYVLMFVAARNLRRRQPRIRAATERPR